MNSSMSRLQHRTGQVERHSAESVQLAGQTNKKGMYNTMNILGIGALVFLLPCHVDFVVTYSFFGEECPFNVFFFLN